MSIVDNIIKDLKNRGITLRLYYTDRPKSINASRSFSYFVDGVGVELFGQFKNLTEDILSVVDKNIKDIF